MYCFLRLDAALEYQPHSWNSKRNKFRPDYGLLLELHTLTLVTRSYALLVV